MVSVIKGLGVYISPYYILVDDLLRHFGKSQEGIDKLKDIIGPHEKITIADMSYIDSVVLALNAFKIMETTSEALGLPIDYNRVEMIRGGTENPPDTSKPTMALAIQELFGIHPNANTGSASAACAVGWNLWSDSANFTFQYPSLEAIFAVADIARHDLGCKDVENKLATVGAGAITALVSNVDLNKDKWLMHSLGSEAYHSQSFQDFWVPAGSPYPEVNGLVSCWCYDLGILGATSAHFKKLDEKEGKKSIEERLLEYDMLLAHAPFDNQVREVFYLLCSGRIDEKIRILEEAIYKQLKNPDSKRHRKPVKAMIEEARSTPGVKEELERLTGQWNEWPCEIGNPYSASIFISLMLGLQEIGDIAKESVDKPLKVLMLFFGSGLTATAASLEVHPFAIKYAQELNVKAMVKDRIKISPEDYIKNLQKETPFKHPQKGYFMRKSPVERGYPEYSKT